MFVAAADKRNGITKAQKCPTLGFLFSFLIGVLFTKFCAMRGYRAHSGLPRGTRKQVLPVSNAPDHGRPIRGSDPPDPRPPPALDRLTNPTVLMEPTPAA